MRDITKKSASTSVESAKSAAFLRRNLALWVACTEPILARPNPWQKSCVRHCQA